MARISLTTRVSYDGKIHAIGVELDVSKRAAEQLIRSGAGVAVKAKPKPVDPAVKVTAAEGQLEISAEESAGPQPPVTQVNVPTDAALKERFTDEVMRRHLKSIGVDASAAKNKTHLAALMQGHWAALSPGLA